MMATLLHSIALLGTLTMLAYLVLLTKGLLQRQAHVDQLFEHENALFKARIDMMANPVSKAANDKGAAAWSGFRKFRVAKKVMEKGDCCSFYLEPHDGRELPAFLPGQYLTFKLKVPGQPKEVTRCYSLSDSPNPQYYRVTIKRVPPPPKSPELPPGVSSNHFHSNVNEGDILDVKAPSGNFHIDVEAQSPVVLIGGGIGVTPMLSMVNYLISLPIKREAHFFYGVRNGSEHMHKELLNQIAQDHPNIHINVCYSDAVEGEEQGKDFQFGERVSVDLFKRELGVNNFDFYTCGPPPMMESITKGLQEWGVPDSRIHYEAFGPATVKKVANPAAAPAADGPALEVKFVNSNRSVNWTSASSSILELAEANGIKIDSGCRAGNCGSCVTTVRSGEVDYPSGKPGFDVEKGCCLACVAVPKAGTALALDA